MKTNCNVSCETLSRILLENKIFNEKASSISFSEKAVSFWKEFVSWNNVHNLSKITSFEDAAHLHFLDSLFPSLFQEPFNNCINVLDLGTGGGFPGIPLSLYYNDIDFHLLDKSRKKISFLQYTSSKLRFSNVYPVNKDFFSLKSSFDMVISRAVRIDEKILLHCKEIISSGGWLVVFRTMNDIPDIKLEPSNSINYTILNKNRSILFYQF